MTSARHDVARWLHDRFPGARIDTLAGDASTRRFLRVHPRTGPSRIVMDYGQPFETLTDDVILTRVFRTADLRVPEILAIAPETGCLLLEDLGDRMLETELASGDTLSWLRRAVSLAAAVAERGTPVLSASRRAGGPALDADRFRFEMDFFQEHFVAGFLDEEPSATNLRSALHGLADSAAAGSRVLSHRDFHSRNIMVTPAGELAMVDIQDARWGPEPYDLASLLRDAYVDIPEEWVDGLIGDYLRALGRDPAEVPFRERFETVAAQRMIKALGTFGFQVGKLGRERYRPALARTVRRLERTLPGHEPTRTVFDEFEALGLFGADAQD